MAFVDFIAPPSAAPVPEIISNAPNPSPTMPPSGTLPPHIYSAFPWIICPHCHYHQPNSPHSGICLNCNLPLAAATHPQHHSSGHPPLLTALQQQLHPPTHHHQHHHPHILPPLSQQQQQHQQCSSSTAQTAEHQHRHHHQQQQQQHFRLYRQEHTADLFTMTSIVDAVNDVMTHSYDVTAKHDSPQGGMTSDEKNPSLPHPPSDNSPSLSLHMDTVVEFVSAIASSPVGSLPSSRRTTPPSSTALSMSLELLPTFEEEELDHCVKHLDDKLAFFCQTCLALVCESCIASEHVHHEVMGLKDAFLLHRPNLKELLGKTQVDVGLLEYSLEENRKMNARIGEKQQEAIEEVKKIFQTHREELAKREQEVMAQINEVAGLRKSSLKKNEKDITSALESVRHLCEVGEKTLQEGSKYETLVAHSRLSSKLRNCRSYTESRTPLEDDSFILKSDDEAAQLALDSLCTLTTAPYPPLCTAMGGGLHHPRVNRLCTVILATKDRAGIACPTGGEKLFVQLKSSNSVSLPIDFRDNANGSYSINFKPRMKGEHQLVIAIRGQHIQGSPFTLCVDGGREYGKFGIPTHVFGSEGSQNSQFCRPWGICCDQLGNIIVGDRSNHRVQVFDVNGVFKHKFGSEGVRPGQFNRPAGVAVTREGDIVVADKDNHRIQVLKIDGTFMFMFGSKGGNDGQMIYPYDVAVNQQDGRIAVTDTGNHRLLIFSNNGILLGKFGYKGYLCGHFDSPRGIAFNDDGHIIVSDFNVHHILVIHPDGTTARILGSQGSGSGQFMRPQGIAIDQMGNFVIADTRNSRIVIMQPNGQFVAKFGVAGTGPGQFDRPTSVAILPDGRMVVVDFGNSRIQIF